MSAEYLLSLPQLTAFVGAALLVALAPGPGDLMVLSLGMSRGRAPGDVERVQAMVPARL